MFDTSIFSERLKNRMKEQGITQTKLSEETGIPQRTISDYTKGKTVPNVLNMNLLCVALKISSDYLLGLSNDETITDYAAISKKTGLSEESIKNIIFMKTKEKDYEYFLNCLLSSDNFERFLSFWRTAYNFYESGLTLKTSDSNDLQPNNTVNNAIPDISVSDLFVNLASQEILKIMETVINEKG